LIRGSALGFPTLGIPGIFRNFGIPNPMGKNSKSHGKNWDFLMVYFRGILALFLTETA